MDTFHRDLEDLEEWDEYLPIITIDRVIILPVDYPKPQFTLGQQVMFGETYQVGIIRGMQYVEDDSWYYNLHSEDFEGDSFRWIREDKLELFQPQG